MEHANYEFTVDFIRILSIPFKIILKLTTCIETLIAIQIYDDNEVSSIML